MGYGRSRSKNLEAEERERECRSEGSSSSWPSCLLVRAVDLEFEKKQEKKRKEREWNPFAGCSYSITSHLKSVEGSSISALK